MVCVFTIKVMTHPYNPPPHSHAKTAITNTFCLMQLLIVYVGVLNWLAGWNCMVGWFELEMVGYVSIHEDVLMMAMIAAC